MNKARSPITLQKNFPYGANLSGTEEKEKAVVAGGRLWIYMWGKKIKRKTRKVETIDLSGLSFEWGYCFRQRLQVEFQNDIFCRGFSPVSVVSHIICADGGSVSVFLHLLRKQGNF